MAAGLLTSWNALKAGLRRQPGKAALLGTLCLALVIIVAVQLLRRPTGAAAAGDLGGDSGEALVQAPADATLATSAVSDARPLPPMPRAPTRDLFTAPWFEQLCGAPDAEVAPIVPAADEGTEPGAWQQMNLEATYVRADAGGVSIAIIDGVTVEEQDRIGPYVVEQIGPRFVVLSEAGQHIVLHMRARSE